MLKELKKKMDYDNEKRKFSAQNQTLQDLVTKNMKTTPKTFSPDHKPINPKISQNSEFCKNNANTISSKLNYVNIDGFFEFKEKFNKNMIKKRDSPTRQRVFSFHKKNNNNNETGSTYGLPLKQQVITETMNSKEVYGSPIKNIMKKQEISGFAKNDNNSEINSLCKGEEKGNKSHFNEEINEKNSLSNEKNTIKKFIFYLVVAYLLLELPIRKLLHMDAIHFHFLIRRLFTSWIHFNNQIHYII